MDPFSVYVIVLLTILSARGFWIVGRPSPLQDWSDGIHMAQRGRKTMDDDTPFARLFPRSELPSKDLSRDWIYAASPGLTSFSSTDRSGKWCIFRPAAEIDAAWAVIQRLAAAGEILLAKVSTRAHAAHFASHVICVYTEDWTNAAQLLATREALRSAGFSEELGYKRDLDTALGVYGGPDEWFLRA